MNLNKELFEIIGIHIGDGCLSCKKKEQYILAGDRVEEKEYYRDYVVPLFNGQISMKIIGKEITSKDYVSVGVMDFISLIKK